MTTKLNELLHWYTTLSADSVKLAIDFYHPHARFKDPFNDVHGVAAIMRIFDHMFAVTVKPHFIIHEQIVQGQQAFISWTFAFILNGKPYSVVGASHLKFNAEGLVIDHRDYWDAAEELLQKLPIVGLPIRWLRGKFNVAQDI